MVAVLAVVAALAPARLAGAQATAEVPVSGTFTAAAPFQTDCGGRGPGISRFVFEGTGDLAPFGPTTSVFDVCTDASAGVDPTPIVSGSTFTITAAGGTFSGDVTGTGSSFSPTPQGFPYHNVLTVTGGTGQFAGATGTLTNDGFVNVGSGPTPLMQAGTVSGTLVLPSVTPPSEAPSVSTLVTGLEGSSGSTIGPDRALYVTEGAAGRVSRVDPETGDVTTFASGLPRSIIGIGGAIDVAFVGNTAYVLVTLVGADVGGSDVVGIYRVDGPNSFTVVADIGAFALANPPSTPFDIPTGVQYAMQPFRRGILVTDGHHNRLLRVTLDGEVIELVTFGNIVPTGLEKRGNRVYMGEAGPVPHLPEDGKVVSFQKEKSPVVTEVASGASLVVDVEFGRGHRLYALAQGDWPPGNDPGSPALPDTGDLVEVNGDGTVTVIAEGLNLPTSLEFIRDTAYVVTLGGEILRIDDVSRGR